MKNRKGNDQGITELRLKAKEAGLQFFSTGNPCRNGHLCERFTSSSLCRQCAFLARDANNKRWRKNYKKDPTKHRAHSKKWAKDNENFTKEYRKKYSAENSEKIIKKVNKWRKENPEKLAINSRVAVHKRRSLKINAGGTFTKDDIKNLLIKQCGKCAGCLKSIKKKYDIDHIIPLSRGGSNDISNIQLLCQHCNRTKQAKDPIVWAQHNGRLL